MIVEIQVHRCQNHHQYHRWRTRRRCLCLSKSKTLPFFPCASLLNNQHTSDTCKRQPFTRALPRSVVVHPPKWPQTEATLTNAQGFEGSVCEQVDKGSKAMIQNGQQNLQFQIKVRNGDIDLVCWSLRQFQLGHMKHRINQIEEAELHMTLH